MVALTRRHILVGAAASATTLSQMVGTPSRAAVPQVGKQAPGFYRYKVGDFEITVVTDGVRSFPLSDTFVVNVKKEEVNAALEAAYMPRDVMTIYFTPIVVNTGSSLVVIDTGYGAAAAEQPTSTSGHFLA